MACGIYAELTADGEHIALVATGDDFEVASAAKALRHLTPAFRKADGALLCPATWAAVTQMARTFSGGPAGQWMPQEKLRKWILEEFLWRNKPTDLVPEVPGGLIPREYQVQGAQLIGSAGKALILDEPGTGKGCTTILGLRIRQMLGVELWPLVLIAPSWDVGDALAREIGMWAPEWPEPVMYGGAKRRELLGSDVLITTYATAALDASDASGPLVKLRAKSVICDEAHYLKNTQAKRTGAVQRISNKATTFVALTGTPITRDTGDIFPVLQAMDPHSYPSRERFVKRYLDTTDSDYGERIEGLKAMAEPEFRAILQGQYRRVSKVDVLSQLPPKVYSVRRVELPPDWRKAYDGLESEMLAELPNGEELPVMSALAQLTRLSQLASSAFDVEVSAELDEVTGLEKKAYKVTLKRPSWKVDSLLGILKERPGQQTAVFANSAQLVLIAAEACVEAGYRCGLIVGGQAKGSRKKSIDDFQAGDLDVILCTAGAGGLGITLTAASTVVLLQRAWALDQALQVEDRAHRYGSKHTCIEIIDIVSKNTVDSRVRTLLRQKSAQLGALVRDPDMVRQLMGGLK